MTGDLADKIETGARLIAAAKKIVVFTGAGISTESGVPDFRGPDGVWTRRDKGLPPPKAKVSVDRVEPNTGHLAIVRLQDMGKLAFLISQNVDNLHLRSGIRLELIAELHGNHSLLKCRSCGAKHQKAEVNWDDGRHGRGYRTDPPRNDQPRCPDCDGRLISSVVNFGDPMPEDDLELSVRHSKACDLFLTVGSSLVVSPANHMPQYALAGGAKLILINQGETPLDNVAHLRFWEGIGQVLPPMVDRAAELM
ncbi:MAG: hypothetical protein KJ621_14290 [Proteobacteria bacterium]|nr:hypothetical protein [Pseudomonadota bacterium]